MTVKNLICQWINICFITFLCGASRYTKVAAYGAQYPLSATLRDLLFPHIKLSPNVATLIYYRTALFFSNLDQGRDVLIVNLFFQI